MKYVFPEYKENVVLGNGKLQLNPMSYQVCIFHLSSALFPGIQST
ncbi:hypothetical protein [Ruminococcus sp. D55t1_190419_H1]|nr:hypothetical protein [Ruminococcus sp. D55t1_190419_H1]